MRKTIKILHTIASAGLIGGLGCYMILLVAGPQTTLSVYADLRQSIALISNSVILPSMALALVTGLISMIVHRPFRDKGWVWVKALLGILMFKGVLTVISAKADYAATVAHRIAVGDAPQDALESLLAMEWGTLIIVTVIAVANIVLGVWRPKLSTKARRATRRQTPAPVPAET